MHTSRPERSGSSAPSTKWCTRSLATMESRCQLLPPSLVIALAHDAYQPAGAEREQRALDEVVYPVAGHYGEPLPAPAAIAGARNRFALLTGGAEHIVGADQQGAVLQLAHSVGFDARYAGRDSRAPGVPVVLTPPGIDTRRLGFVAVLVIVLVADNHQPAIAQPADPRRYPPFLAAAPVCLVDDAGIAPGRAVVTALDYRYAGELGRPVIVGFVEYTEQLAAGQEHDVGILGEVAVVAVDGYLAFAAVGSNRLVALILGAAMLRA